MGYSVSIVEPDGNEVHVMLAGAWSVGYSSVAVLSTALEERNGADAGFGSLDGLDAWDVALYLAEAIGKLSRVKDFEEEQRPRLAIAVTIAADIISACIDAQPESLVRIG